MTISGDLRSAVPPLVGREREQAVLRDRLTAALAGHGSLVLIGGEAGIGKTALAEAFCHEATEQGALVLVGRCYDLTDTPPYGPWIELFGRYQPTNEMPSLPAAFARRGTVGTVTSQAALVQQVLDFLTTLAAQRPLVLLLDDLHWADPASLDLLRAVARTAATLSLLVLATYRADEVVRGHPLYPLIPTLVREARVERLDLHPLSVDDLRELLAGRYSLSPADAARLIVYLQERTEGNPFFLGELLRALQEEGALRAKDDGWTLADLTRIRVPALLRQVIDGRLSRLGEDAQQLLGVASVIGQEVPFALWSAVTGIDDEQLLDVVEQATIARVVEASADGLGFRFIHALIREALYEGILPLRRRVQHRQIGEALTILPDADPDAVAYHFRQAGDIRAAAWLVRAGERAQAAYAVETAADRYEAACALLSSTRASEITRGWLLYRLAMLRRGISPRSPADAREAAHLAAMSGDQALAAGARFALAFMQANQHTSLGLLPELAASVDALEALTPDDHARLNTEDGLAAADASKPWRGSLIFHLALVGQYAQAVAMGERFLKETAPPTTGGMLRGFAYGGSLLGLGIAYAMLGQPARAHAAFGAARTLHRTVGSYHNIGQTVQMDLSLVILPYYTDHVEERRALAREAEQSLAHSWGPFYEAFTQMNRTPLLCIEGDWAQAHAFALQAAPYPQGATRRLICEQHGWLLREQGESRAAWEYVHEIFPAGVDTPPGSVQHEIGLAMQRLATRLALDAGDWAAARTWLEAYDRWLGWSGTVLGRAEGQVLWAAYYRATADLTRAYQHAECSLTDATTPRQPLALIAAHRVLGELDTDAGRYDDAAKHLDASLALAEACAVPYERALTLLALAQLRTGMQQEEAAPSLLSSVRAICEPLGAKPVLARADALAASFTTTRIHPDGLSSREVEVLHLIAAGSSNQEIADTLSISVRTVERHITNLYAKIGADGRADATAYALRHVS